jgi:filamentous hemagglutinin
MQVGDSSSIFEASAQVRQKIGPFIVGFGVGGFIVKGSKIGSAIETIVKTGKTPELPDVDAPDVGVDPPNAPNPTLALPSPTYRVPDGFRVTTNADGSVSVTGPGGGSYNPTGFYDNSGKPVYRDTNGKYYTLDGGRRPTRAPTDYTAVQVHHICTDKCDIGPNGNPAWTPEFRRFFDNAGLDIDSEINKIAVPGHRGRHPQEYHQYVYAEITQSVQNLSMNTPQYKAALERALTRLEVEAVTPGSQMNRWLTRS